MRIPSIRLYGKRKAQILTHKGIKSCSDRHIEIFSVAGVICVCGRQLEITEINDDSMGAEYYDIDLLTDDKLSNIARLAIEGLNAKDI